MNGIRFPLAVKSILYICTYYKFYAIKINVFTLTTSKFLSCKSCFVGCDSSSCLTLWTDFLPYWSNCYLHADLNTALKQLGFPHSPLIAICMAMSCTCPVHSICSFPLVCVLGVSLSYLGTLSLTLPNSFVLFYVI